jgi:oligopeptidase B
MRYFVAHHSGTFYIVTNDNATNFKLMTAPVANPAKANWQELIRHRPQVRLDDVELFAGHMVVYERENGLKTLRISRLLDGDTHYVSFPEPVYTFKRSPNPEFDSKTLRFNYMSLTTSDSEIEYHMETRERVLIKQKPVLGGYDPADYQSERVFATAADGAQVPISLVYRKGLVKDGTPPCLLYGYGSYGANMDPAFDEKRLSLIDRGIIYAIAHIRGGEEMGRSWYEQGKFLYKKNTFSDFISCAKHLISQGYASSAKLAIMGRSAGGLLMGAVVNSAPGLFKAVVAGVPFVDVVTTMLDDSIPLTVGEFEEWGNPKDKAYYDYMLSYSPYDNTTAQAYPHMLITAGLNDPRVQYWEPAKWTAKLRSMKRDDNTLLLKTFMGAGHFSSSGRYDYLKDAAFEYAFLLDVLGVAGD